MKLTKQEISLPRLNRAARLYVAVPEQMVEGIRYPVLYMHDGHNLFLPEDSFTGITWGVLESDRRNPRLPKVIIVGLECADGERRFSEYSGYPFENFDFEMGSKSPLGGLGDLYLYTIVHEIKPLIDCQYPTLPEREHTGMMGSSMGGVISHYAALTKGRFFTRFGSLSGAFFVSERRIIQETLEADLSHIQRFYMAVGTNESGIELAERYLQTNQRVFQALSKKIPSDRLRFDRIQGGIHHESAWAQQFPQALGFLFDMNHNEQSAKEADSCDTI